MTLEKSEAPEFDVAAQCEHMISYRIGTYPRNWEGLNRRKHAIEMLLFEFGPGHHVSVEKERLLGIDQSLRGKERERRTQETLVKIRAHLEAELAKIQQ